MEEHLELLDKVVIEKAVEERVGAGRRHSKHVKEGESNHQGFCNIFAYPSNCNTTHILLYQPVSSKRSNNSVRTQKTLKGSQLKQKRKNEMEQNRCFLPNRENDRYGH